MTDRDPLKRSQAAAAAARRGVPSWNAGRRTTGGLPAALGGLDGRMTPQSRYRRALADLMASLGREPSRVESTLLRRAASLMVLGEELDAKIAAGEATAADAAEARRTGYAGLHLLAQLGLLTTKPTDDDARRAREEAEDREAGFIR